MVSMILTIQTVNTSGAAVNDTVVHHKDQIRLKKTDSADNSFKS